MKQLPTVEIWGSGKPYREFLFVDDMAAASVYVMNISKDIYEKNTSPRQSHINVGYGSDITISQLSAAVAKVIGYSGEIRFDTTKPDGAPRKLMDSSLLKNLGWSPTVDIELGLSRAYQDFLTHKA